MRLEKKMKVKKQKLQYLNSVLSVLLIICIIVLNVHVNICWAIDDEIVKKNNIITSMVKPASSTEKTEETVIKDPEDNENVTSTEKNDAEPQSQKTSTGSILLYSGIGVAAVVAVAAAVGVGGSSDSVSETTSATTTTSTPTPTTKTPTTPKPKITTPKDNNPAGAEPVGADIGGDNWTGFIDLVGGPRESISSSISQHGNYVVITTSSHQKYGQKLVGNIAADGFMKLFDQRTGEDWTTHFGNATANKIDLYDFVHNNFKEVDQIFLQR